MTEAPTEAPRFPVGMTAAATIACAILIGLGVWQLQRLKWKEGILAHVAALQTANPVDIGPVLDHAAKGADVGYTRVSAACPGLSTAPFLELYAIGPQGAAGDRLISACEVQSASYRSILVDRGFIQDTSPERPKVDASDRRPVQLVGVLRKPDKPSFIAPKNRPPHWFIRDIPAMAAALHAPAPAPVMLYAETKVNPELKALDPSSLPPQIPNRHFEYALTWFGLAAALAWVYAAALLRRMRG